MWILGTLLFFSTSVTGKVTRIELANANQALMTAIEAENSCTTSADCATVPVGARACGGPGGYAVYATKSSNAQQIKSLATVTAKLERQFNEENGVISICSIVAEPTVQCNENKCVAAGMINIF